MDTLPLLGIALGLAMDAFSVAVATGVSQGYIKPRPAFRLSFHFGLFQFMMPIIGWMAGISVSHYISSYDHWIAFFLLAGVGAKMIRDSLSAHPDAIRADPTKGSYLVMLSFATSIDALAVGLSMAVLGVPILLPAAIIGVVAATMTLLGLRIGIYAGDLLGSWIERLGGVILIIIGIKILLEHMV